MNPSVYPKLLKAQKVKGKSLVFRDAKADDAEFILSLRTNEKKSRFLSFTPADLNAQRKWLENYVDAQDQVYFIIEYKGEAIGTVRLYDPKQGSFCWGSWILKDGSPTHAAIESALMIYAYAMDHLGFRAAHFDVRKGNESVWKFHEKFGATRIEETDLDYIYTLDLNSIEGSRSRYKKFLPAGVTVTRSQVNC